MNKAEKSLRWVVNQIPDFKPTTNEEKMLLAIKLYSEAGAEEIKRLEAENAALRERLEKAVELPVKVGDTVWLVGHIHGALACVDASITYVSMNEHFVRYTAQEGEWFHDFNDDYIGRYVFLTKQEAETKLAELEEKDDEETDKS